MLTQMDPDRSPLAATLEQFFATKTSCDVDGTMAYFSPQLITYIDATLGWEFPSFDASRGVFTQYMPNWAPTVRSYATAISSNATSALAHMVDTPELFGGELRVLAAIDLDDAGKIIRWVDYWDAAGYDAARYAQFRTPSDQFPGDLRDGIVPTQAAPALVTAATDLQEALGAGDATAIGDRLHTDVVVIDMALRAHVLGRLEAVAYLGRVLAAVPYGRGSTLRHVGGGEHGGGFEWTAGGDHDGLKGITAIELDGDGLVTTMTSVYDSRQLAPERKAALIAAASPPEANSGLFVDRGDLVR